MNDPENLTPNSDQNTPDDESEVERQAERNAVDIANPEHTLTIEEIEKRHTESVQDYDFIQFLPGEYVAIDVERTSLGYLKNWLLTALFALIMVFALIELGSADWITSHIRQEAFLITVAVGLAVILISSAFALVATYIFRKNRLILTNERVFRREQLTPFSYNDQNIELSRIENCSFSQNGLIQQMFDYGSISLKTVGDETTYKFDYASDPKDQFQIVNLMVEEAGTQSK